MSEPQGRNRDCRNETAPKVCNALVQSLEPRQFLSAAVSHGVLIVEGTPRSDTIVISRGTRGNFTVRVNDAVTSFSKKSFSRIRIAAGRRDDLVTIGSDAMPITIRASVSGGDGSDTIVGGAGDDSLDGGAGADQITGAAGNDTINGDNGADDLHGGDGGDSICGGRGDDQLHDDGGYDTVFGNAGTDLYYFGDSSRIAGATSRATPSRRFTSRRWRRTRWC
jgi:Ca2+-binding RTX toxin-like protein